MKSKSMFLNSIILMVKNVIGILSPMIIYKIATSKLDVVDIGSIEFSKSIISYFQLIATMGISTVAIRECSKVRNNQKEVRKIASQIYGINLISLVGSLSLLFCLLFIIDGLMSNRQLIAIYSLTIIFIIIGKEWIYSIYENYLPLAVSTSVCQVIALIMTFCLVRNSDDVYIYDVILVISSSGYGLISVFLTKRYLRIRPAIYKETVKYIKPVLILFFSNIASKIYTNADVTMLGFIRGDYDVGMYSAAVKIYDVFHVIVSVGITVVLPRATQLVNRTVFDLKTQDKAFSDFMNLIMKTFLLFILPCSFFTLLYGTEEILLISGMEYMNAINPLIILALTLPIATINMVICNTILIPREREKVILISTVAGAVSNILLNLFFIPQYGYTGAAVTTFISEIIVCSFYVVYSWRELCFLRFSFFRDVMSVTIGLGLIYGVYRVLNFINFSSIITLVFAASISVLLYCFILLIFKNEVIKKIIESVLGFYKNR